MPDSACSWFIAKKAEIFLRYVKHLLESWLVYPDKLVQIAKPYFSTDTMKRSQYQPLFLTFLTYVSYKCYCFNCYNLSIIYQN